MKKVGILILFLVIAAGGGLLVCHYMATPRVEGVAHLKPAKIKPFSDLVDYSSSYTIGKKEKPDEFLDLPAGISASDNAVCYFFTLSVGKKEVLALIPKPVSDTAQIWIDTDMDHHLSDEKALTSTLRKHSERGDTWRYFDFGKIQLKDENTTAEFGLLTFNEGSYISTRPVACMKGKIRLGGHVYRIAVVDGDYDGKFNTPYEPSADYRYFGCDVFIADTSHGLISPYDNGKLVPLGKFYKFTRERYGTTMPADEKTAECYFRVDISTDGKTLQMQPAEPEMGTLKIGEDKRLSIRLFSDTATQWVNFRDTIELPAGRYQMHYGQLSYMPENKLGFETSVDFLEDIRKGQFEIKPGETVTLNPGPPFTVKTYANGGSDNQISIDAGMTGNEGEEYGLRISRDMPKPVLKILNENGVQMHSGQMEYG